MVKDSSNLIDFDFHLHCKEHSDCGRQTMEELLERANRANIKLLALTDHNTVAGIFDIKKKASKYGITVINGTELSVSIGLDILPEHPGVIIGVLGLNFKLDKQLFTETVLLGLNRQKEALNRIARGLEKEHHIFIEKKDSITNIAKGLFYSKVFPSVSEAENFLLAPEQMKKNVLEQLYPKEAIDLIHAMGGKAILSHPFRGENRIKLSHEEVSKIIEALVSLGLDGIELFHPENFGDDSFEDFYFLEGLIKKHQLLVSLGSDRHSSHDKIVDKYFSKDNEWEQTKYDFASIKEGIMK
jgi:predicted metal-dependent phosphoesterase TrpH